MESSQLNQCSYTTVKG